jgi:hypothetical protein
MNQHDGGLKPAGTTSDLRRALELWAKFPNQFVDDQVKRSRSLATGSGHLQMIGSSRTTATAVRVAEACVTSPRAPAYAITIT